MNILYTLNSGQFGGMERHVMDLVEGMIIKGHSVHVWCSHGPLVEDFKNKGAVVYEKDVRFDIDPFYISEIRDYIRKHNIDVVHAHELKAVVNTVIGAKNTAHLVISHTHTPISEWNIPQFKKKLNLLVYPKVVNIFSDYEIALTKSRKRVKTEEGIKKEKLKIIKHANAVRLEEVRVSESDKNNHREKILKRHNVPFDAVVWGTIGRISEEKGHMVLLEAFSKYLEKQTAANHFLMVVGGGPTEELFKQKVKDFGLEDKVVVTGRFVDEDKKSYYSSLNYFIHPSQAEGFGIVLVEAMVAGVPLIASDLEVFKEVGGKNLTYFKVGSSNDLSDKMLLVFENKDKYKDLALKAASFAKSMYSLELFVNEYEAFYLQQLSVK